MPKLWLLFWPGRRKRSNMVCYMIIARVTLRPLKPGDKDVLTKATSLIDEIGGDGEPSLWLFF